MKKLTDFEFKPRKKLVGFCGLKGTGKTVAARHLVDTMGYTDVQFSGGLKAMLKAYLEYNDIEDTDIYMEGIYKNHKSKYFCNKSFRHAMQTLGTEWGREQIGKKFWIEAWQRKIDKLELVTASDVRFPEEVAAIKENGGIIIKILRPKHINQDFHESESHISDISADHEVINDDLVVFKRNIARIVNKEFIYD